MKKEIRHLKNAPIVEALIDLRLSHSVEIDPEFRDAIRRELDDEAYPTVQEQRLFKAELEIGKGETRGVELGVRGYQFSSNPKLEIAQFQIDGFTFIRLKPYTSWEAVRDEAMKLWAVYRKVFSPVGVSRIATRYINRIQFGPDEFDFAKVLNEPFEVPSDVPPSVSQYLFKATHHVEDSSRFVIVTQSMDLEPSSRRCVFTLDIDAVDRGSFGCEPENLVEGLDRIRDLKNLVFFRTLTDEMISEFE